MQGSIMQGIQTNLKQLHSYYKGKKKQYYSSKPVKTSYDFPEISDVEMKNLKSKIQNNIKQQKQREIILTIILTLIVFISIYILIN